MSGLAPRPIASAGRRPRAGGSRPARATARVGVDGLGLHAREQRVLEVTLVLMLEMLAKVRLRRRGLPRGVRPLHGVGHDGKPSLGCTDHGPESAAWDTNHMRHISGLAAGSAQRLRHTFRSTGKPRLGGSRCLFVIMPPGFPSSSSDRPRLGLVLTLCIQLPTLAYVRSPPDARVRRLA